MLRRLIQTGLLVAAVAAVAGVAYGAIPSSNGTITACVDSKGALKVIDAEAGATCGAGKQSLTWNQQGPAGGVSGWEKVVVAAPGNSDDRKSLVASCPAGKVVVGGGGWTAPTFVDDPLDGVALQISAPNGNGNAWVVTAREIVPTSQNWILWTYALCATAS